MNSKYGYQKPYNYQSGIPAPSNLRETSKPPAAVVVPQAQIDALLPVTPEVQQKTNLNRDIEATPTESPHVEPSAVDIITTAVLWENLALSTILCLAGIFVALLGDYLLQGKHGIPLLSGISYAILFSVGINFVRSVVSVQWQTKCNWVNSATVKSVAAQADGFVMKIAALHDKYLSAREPVLTLKVTLILWSLVYLGYTLSLWRLMCLAYFGAFILGGIRTFFASQLSRGYESSTSIIKAQWGALGLKRGHGAVVLALIVFTLAYISTWTTRALIVLLGLMVVRCNLKPSEVDVIANRATDMSAPYVHSAKKQARRLSMAATDFMRRSSHGSAAKDHRK